MQIQIPGWMKICQKIIKIIISLEWYDYNDHLTKISAWPNLFNPLKTHNYLLVTSLLIWLRGGERTSHINIQYNIDVPFFFSFSSSFQVFNLSLQDWIQKPRGQSCPYNYISSVVSESCYYQLVQETRVDFHVSKFQEDLWSTNSWHLSKCRERTNKIRYCTIHVHNKYIVADDASTCRVISHAFGNRDTAICISRSVNSLCKRPVNPAIPHVSDWHLCRRCRWYATSLLSHV
jgi:hypothetical protein